MPRRSSARRQSVPEAKIVAYGFDIIIPGAIPSWGTIIPGIGKIDFVRFGASATLHHADGVIIPQGIFETIDQDSYEASVGVYEDLLLERERQTVNLLRKGKWVCFLVGAIVDSVRRLQGWREITDTDLCKRMLNEHGVRRNLINGAPCTYKDDEFKAYMDNYGVAKTAFSLPLSEAGERRVIANAGNQIVGFEIDRQLFFLPFHTTRKDMSGTRAIVTTVTRAIWDYRQKRVVQLPEWLDEFRHESENELGAELSSLMAKSSAIQDQLLALRKHKAILTTSGDVLKTEVIRILTSFFQLKVDPIDEHREDAKILDDDGNTLAVIEIKGVKSGVKREHINQVDSHRERNDLSSAIPGALIINNQMSISGINERLETTVANEQVKHAERQNVLIIRTIDLLFLMRALENSPNRGQELQKIISSSGGGWLQADWDGYRLVC